MCINSPTKTYDFIVLELKDRWIYYKSTKAQNFQVSINLTLMIWCCAEALIFQSLQAGAFYVSSESLNHLFLHCSFANQIWSLLLKEFGFLWAMPRFYAELLELPLHLVSVAGAKVLWRVATLTIFWSIWLKRNHIIFEDHREDDFVMG